MPVESVSAVVQFGLEYERMRLETAARNLAVANVALVPGSKPIVQAVSAKGVFAGALPEIDVQSRQNIETRKVHDPSHPLADSSGMVNYPRIDPAIEMATLVAATRAYEADVRAYNTLRAMTLKAFEIGK